MPSYIMSRFIAGSINGVCKNSQFNSWFDCESLRMAPLIWHSSPNYCLEEAKARNFYMCVDKTCEELPIDTFAHNTQGETEDVVSGKNEDVDQPS
jgi:hypothetical protein